MSEKREREYVQECLRPEEVKNGQHSNDKNGKRAREFVGKRRQREKI